MTRTIFIEEDDCIGCEACVDLSPDVFQYSDSMKKANVVNPQGAPEEELEEAISLCPTRCIQWEE